ncbi:MAG TPA: HypC/HybG/HupF family hydrogenase formation chaperone [Desulfobulbus sp.]|nr:HypC/HybG/HupF family hydrogenase formation chaperone [Desulfobulbus sp.]
MCLAIPMKVVEIREGGNSLFAPGLAIVDADGIRREVRLDLVDRQPEIGDYLIIHAGFAIHCLDPAEARANLRLMQQMAAAIDQDPGDGK